MSLVAGIRDEKYRPVSRRTLAISNKMIQQGRVGFLLGAGVDALFASIASANSDKDIDVMNYTWGGLLYKMYKKTTPTGRFHDRFLEKEFSSLINDWPTEIASEIRSRMPNDQFFKSIYEALNTNDLNPYLEGDTIDILCKLLSQSNLIVTTNYTTFLDKILIKRLKNLQVIDRENLGSFSFPEPNDLSKIYLIHIHGRCEMGTTPILDAWGYNVAERDDKYYMDFLKQLFKNRSLISIGTSWKDIPLRNTAAYVFRTVPYLNHGHIALNRITVPESITCKYCCQDSKPKGGCTECESLKENVPYQFERRKSNIMTGIYNVHFVNYKSEDSTVLNLPTLETVMSDLSKPIKTPSNLNCLGEIADFLDESGDYESSLQHDWMASVVSPGKKDKVRKNKISATIETIYSLLLEPLANSGLWKEAIRIERHLRHHLWLYSEDAHEKRKGLWQKLASYDFLKKEWGHLDPRLQFDFLVGMYENKVGNTFRKKFEKYGIDETNLSERFRLAKNIWDPYKRLSEVERQNLSSKLLDTGWESMAAKVLADEAVSLIPKTKRGVSDIIWRKIVSVAEQAEVLARSISSYRRRVKADIIIALWGPDPDEGRIRLMGRLNNKESIEAPLISGIAVGIVGCYLRKGTWDESVSFNAVKEMLKGLGLNEDIIESRHFKYHIDLMPPNIKSRWGKIVTDRF